MPVTLVIGVGEGKRQRVGGIKASFSVCSLHAFSTFHNKSQYESIGHHSKSCIDPEFPWIGKILKSQESDLHFLRPSTELSDKVRKGWEMGPKVRKM